MTETESKIYYLETGFRLNVSNAHGKYYVYVDDEDDKALVIDEDQLDALISIVGRAKLNGYETGHDAGYYEREYMED